METRDRNALAVPPPVSSDQTWAVFCHVSALSALVGVPFGNILGPLIVWLSKRGESPSVDAHGRESLNFQISMTLYALLAGVVAICLLLTVIGIVLLPLLIPFLFLPIVNIVFVVVASIKAGRGGMYRYPLTIRFLN